MMPFIRNVKLFCKFAISECLYEMAVKVRIGVCPILQCLYYPSVPVGQTVHQVVAQNAVHGSSEDKWDIACVCVCVLLLQLCYRLKMVSIHPSVCLPFTTNTQYTAIQGV